MQGARIRLTAAVLLAGWLFPIGLPALCRSVPRPADAGCEEPMPSAPVTHGAALAAGESHQLPCANPALCGVVTTVVPTMPAPVLAATSPELAALFVVLPLHSGAPRAPLPPPPQA